MLSEPGRGVLEVVTHSPLCSFPETKHSPASSLKPPWCPRFHPPGWPHGAGSQGRRSAWLETALQRSRLSWTRQAAQTLGTWKPTLRAKGATWAL